MELSEPNTRFRVIGLQLGVEYVSMPAYKVDRDLTLGRRHQLMVLVGDENMKSDRKKNQQIAHMELNTGGTKTSE